MKKLLCIFALNYCIFGVAGYSYPGLGKCCPNGQVISVQKDFTCYPAVNRSPMIYQFRNHTGCGPFWRHPDSKSLSLTRVDDVDESTIGANFACIDVEYDDEGHGNLRIPVIFMCASNPSSEDIARADSYTKRVFPMLRMCRGIDQVYDVRKRNCVFKKNGLNLPNNFKFLNGSPEFVSAYRGEPTCKSAIVNYVVNATRDLRVLDDNRLEVVLATKDGPRTIIATANNTCFDTGTAGTSVLVVVRTCNEAKFCDKNPCVRKCCREDQAVITAQALRLSCGKIPPEVPPGYFHNTLQNLSVNLGFEKDVDFLESSDYGMLIGPPCIKMHRLYSNKPWHFTPQGYIYSTQNEIYGHDEYCIEMHFGSAQVYSNDIVYPVRCSNDFELSDYFVIRLSVHFTLNSISFFFLVVTLLVYICLPVLHNIHGKTLMSYVVSVIVSFVSIWSGYGIMSSTNHVPGSGGTICKLFGFMALFSFTAFSSWLNVMCFDMWWTFGERGGVATPGIAYKKRFVMYSLYAWGVGLFITCIAAIADTTQFLTAYLRPNIGVNDCWFHARPDLNGELIFFIGPMFIQQITNIIFFVLTARHCSRVKAEINRVTASETDPQSRRYKADRKIYTMNAKLFIAMDVGWILKTMHDFLVHYDLGLTWRRQVFFVADISDDLRGVVIFVLFVLKRKIYNELRGRLRKLRLGRETASNTYHD